MREARASLSRKQTKWKNSWKEQPTIRITNYENWKSNWKKTRNTFFASPSSFQMANGKGLSDSGKKKNNIIFQVDLILVLDRIEWMAVEKSLNWWNYIWWREHKQWTRWIQTIGMEELTHKSKKIRKRKWKWRQSSAES